MSVKLSLSLKLWLSEYVWQSFGERENFSKSIVGILCLLSNLEKIISISLSPLESGEPFFKFLFLLSKLGKGISGFSFSSRNWRKEYQISLSLLDWTFWPLVNDWGTMQCEIAWNSISSQIDISGASLKGRFKCFIQRVFEVLHSKGVLMRLNNSTS